MTAQSASAKETHVFFSPRIAQITRIIFFEHELHEFHELYGWSIEFNFFEFHKLSEKLRGFREREFSNTDDTD